MTRVAVALLALFLAACSAPKGEVATVAVPATRVTAISPVTRDIDYVLTALGSVESIHSPTVSAETSGQILAIQASEGDRVTAGQRLASIDDTLHQIESAKADAELKRQSVVVVNQQEEVARLGRLQKTQSVSEDQLEDQQAQLAMLEAQRVVARQQLARARFMQSKTRVEAPRAGLVSRRHVSIGDYVTPGTPLFDLVSVDRLRARLTFPERNAPRIQVGMEVRLVSPAAADVAAVGEVTSVNPLIRVHSRALEVMVEFDNPGGWLPGASVDASLVVQRKPDALTLPVASVVTRSENDVVFLLRGDRVAVRPVELGWREAGWVEVLSGLELTDRVVGEGAALLSEGSLVSEQP